MRPGSGDAGGHGAAASLRQDEPLLAVDQFTHDVEVPGMAGDLSHHVHDDFAQALRPPVPEEVLRPPPRRCVERGYGDDVVGERDLLSVLVENCLGGTSGATCQASAV